MEVLQAKNLKKIYGSGNNAVHALDGVDLSVKKGEFVAIVGTSGSGKSTLLHMLGGLDRPTSGTVMVDGQDIFSLKEEALTIFRRRKIGFVFQAYNLVPVLNVYENIVLPIELDGGKVNKDFVQQIVQTLGLEKKQVSKTDVGQSLYSFYGYVTDGIYQDLADIERSPKPEKYPTNGVFNGSNTVYVGDIKYKDLNGDGVINELDQTNIGSPMPKFTFGWTNTFRYKDFDLNIFINGSYGNKVMNLTKRGLTNMSSVWCNQHTDVLNRARLEPIDASIVYADGSKWYEHIENVRVANPNASLPRAIIGDPNDNDRISDRYVEDGSYLRMKNISLGYTFPKKWIGKWGIENLRVYCNIQNLFTITGYDGYDPEIGVSTMSRKVYGVDYGRYPSPTTYSFGLNMSF